MRAIRLPFLALLLASSLAACNSDPGGSLFNPDETGGPAPVISSISPEGVILAGIDEVTINGQNFSATPEHNIVYFDDGAGAVAQGTVLSATPTELRVRVPNSPNPNHRVRVAVRGAQDFSNEVPFPLTPAFVTFGDLDPGIREEVFGMTSDEEGNVYASLFANGSAVGVKKFSAEGVRSDYFPSTFVWSDLTVGPDGELYGARRLRALFRLPEGGTQQTFSVFPNGVSLVALTSSEGGYIWAAGSNTSASAASIYRISPEGTAEAFPFEGSASDLVTFNGSLYAATSHEVWAFPIGPDGALGEGAVYYDATGDLSGTQEISAITFAADGTLFVGTTAPADPIIEVSPSGEATPLYPGVLSAPVTAFAWAPGSSLYVALAPVAAAGSSPASPPRLIRLETRREGGQ